MPEQTLPLIEPATVAFPVIDGRPDQPPLAGPSWSPPEAVLARVGPARHPRWALILAAVAMIALVGMVLVPLVTIG